MKSDITLSLERMEKFKKAGASINMGHMLLIQLLREIELISGFVSLDTRAFLLGSINHWQFFLESYLKDLDNLELKDTTKSAQDQDSNGRR